MRKCFCVLAVVLVLAASLTAGVKFNLGLKAGLSLSDARWSDDDGSEKALVRPSFGVLAVFDLTPTLALQPEVDYLTVGEKWEGIFDMNDRYEEVLYQTYLHIPVLLKVRLSQKGRFVPSILAGPALSVLLSARDKEWYNGNLGYDANIKDEFRSMEFGADMGLAGEYMMKGFKLFLDLRYYLGLTDPYIPTDYTVKNNALIIAAGVLF
jgi:hypothetical protein